MTTKEIPLTAKRINTEHYNNGLEAARKLAISRANEEPRGSPIAVALRLLAFDLKELEET